MDFALDLARCSAPQAKSCCGRLRYWTLLHRTLLHQVRLQVAVLYVLLLTLVVGVQTQAQAGSVRVYAAASLSNVLNEVAVQYQKNYPDSKIIPVYAASSTLAKQIAAGASSDLFYAADLDWMKYLQQKKWLNAAQVGTVLSNQLVLIAAKGAQIRFQAHPSFAFAQSFNGHLCTGQMQSVPAGKYAKQSLSALQWLASLTGRIVETDDVRAALTFVERGECRLGIVYKTDALISNKVQIVGTFPDTLHAPILYPVALTRQGENNPEAIRFKQFSLHSPQAQRIYHNAGFILHPQLRPSA